MFLKQISASDITSEKEYSHCGTSDGGPSEIGIVYNRPLYKGHCLRSQLFTLPIVLIHLQPPRRGQHRPLYKGQNKWIYIVPNRLYCPCIVKVANWIHQLDFIEYHTRLLNHPLIIFALSLKLELINLKSWRSWVSVSAVVVAAVLSIPVGATSGSAMKPHFP